MLKNKKQRQMSFEICFERVKFSNIDTLSAEFVQKMQTVNRLNA